MNRTLKSIDQQTETERNFKFCEQYHKGKTYRELMIEFGISNSRVYALIKRDYEKFILAEKNYEKFKELTSYNQTS